jgi:hypothetical protein
MSERTQIVVQAIVVLLVFAAALYGIVTSLSLTPPPVSATGSTQEPAASAIGKRSPGPSASGGAASPTAPAPSPTASRQPVATSPYSFGGHTYTGVDLGTGWTIVAPFDGRAEVHVYQLIDGVIREFTDQAGTPSYPYVIVTAGDGRKLTYRPGALTTDTQLLVRASQVKAGDDLFSIVGSGRSSWHDFYDASISFKIVVSLVSAAGADADAASLVKAR